MKKLIKKERKEKIKGEEKGSRFIKFLKTAVIAAVICGFAGGIALTVMNLVVMSTSDMIISPEEATELENVDLVIVLGCFVRNDGTPSHMLEDRIDFGVKLYKLGVSEKLLLSGDSRYEGYDEVGTMKRVSVENGVPKEAIITDGYGLSTYDSIKRAKELYDCDNIVIVTQKYHLYRAIYIAEQLGIEAHGVASNPREYSGQVFRDAREVLSRAKDLVFCIIDAEPEMGAEAWVSAE